MEEGQPVGTVVLDVGPLARSRLTAQQRTQHSTLTLQLANGEPEKHFELADGKLRVARLIDREALCPSTSTSAAPCELSPSVVIRDGAHYTLICTRFEVQPLVEYIEQYTWTVRLEGEALS